MLAQHFPGPIPMRVFHDGNFVACLAKLWRFTPPPQQFWQPLLLVVFEIVVAMPKNSVAATSLRSATAKTSIGKLGRIRAA